MRTRVSFALEKDFARIDKAGYFADFRALLDALSGARFDAKRKVHTATFDRIPSIVRRLRALGVDVEIEPAVQSKLDAIEAASWLDMQAAEARLARVEGEFRKQGKALYPFQRVGVGWLVSKHAALLGDQQGLGKTIQTLSAIPAGAPVLVICPSVVKGVWAREITSWRPGFKTKMLVGRDSFAWPDPGEVAVINFDILPRAHEDGCERVKVTECTGCAPASPSGHGPTCKKSRVYCTGCTDIGLPQPGTVVVIDEAHNARNLKTLRGEACKRVATEARQREGRVYLLTGTPLLNKPEELWSVLSVGDLARDAFGSFDRFQKAWGAQPRLIERYKKGVGRVTEQRGFVWGDSPSPAIAENLQRVMLRRMRADVMPDLPDKTVKLVPVEIDRAALRLCDELLEAVGGVKEVETLLSASRVPFQLISKTRAALAAAKTSAMLAMVEELEEDGEKVVVFSAHRAPIDALEARKVDGWAFITGDVSAKKRTQIEDAFQAEGGDLHGIGMTIKAGGVGITLTKAAFGIFVDQEFVPGLNAQAEDRLVRIGQKRHVEFRVLVAKHPLDERLAEILASKTKMAGQSVDAARSEK